MQPTHETTELAPTTCRRCGQVTMYEPIIIAGIDFGKNLHVTCDTCTRAIEAEELAIEREKIRLEREDRITALLPPDLRLTREDHPSFNRGLWQAVSQWRPSKEAFWLGLIGPAGRCKTRCLALAAMAAIRRGVRVTWTTANRLLEAAQDRTSKDRQTALLAREHLQDCRMAGWLIIDDLGKNEWTNAFESQFFQILDHRKNFRLPLLFSSNAHPESFGLVLSDLNREPIIGRLMDRTTIYQIRK